MNSERNETQEADKKKGGSSVDITKSENDDPRADADPGRTPGKAEGVEDPEREGNE
jgi:hypothetical protein